MVQSVEFTRHIPPMSPIGDEDVALYRIGQTKLSEQYGARDMLCAILSGQGETHMGFSIDTLFEHLSAPVAHEISQQCTDTLRQVEEVLGTPDCVKHVHTASMFTFSTDRLTARVTALGTNGWQPAFLPSEFNIDETRGRLTAELKRLGLGISDEKINEYIASMTRAQAHSLGLSCTQIHHAVQALGGSELTTDYCRIGLHNADSKRLPNTHCPSFNYCAEGTAIGLKRVGVVLAKLFRLPTVTVIDAAPIDNGYVRIRFIPAALSEAKNYTGRYFTLVVSGTSVDFRTNGINTFAEKDFDPVSDGLPFEEETIIYAKPHAQDGLHIQIGSSTDTRGTFRFEKTIEAHPSRLGSHEVTNSVMIGSFLPCASCALSHHRWGIPDFIGRDPEIFFYERLSRHDEKVDAGDILPAAYLLRHGVNLFRFGLNLPPARWR